MIGHLGSRVSALLDGQLTGPEAERAWEHVHACHSCRDVVEREGWVKTRLAGMSHQGAAAPDHLKGFLRGASPGVPPGDVYLAIVHEQDQRRRSGSLVAIGGGAVGAAVLGVLALGAAPADAPSMDRRTPVTSIRQSDPPRPTFGPTGSPATGQPQRTAAP